MNKRIKLISVLLLLLLVLFLGSCRSDGPSGTNISGLWSGPVYTANNRNKGPVVFEFSPGGGFNMGDTDDEIIWDEAIGKNYTWSLGENYLEITGMAGLYFAEYAYDFSDDGDTLILVLIRRNFINETYDEINCGDLFFLTRDEVNDFSFYFSSDYSSDYPYY